MRKRLRSMLEGFADGARPRVPHVSLAVAMREALKAGYDRSALKTDLLAGVVVGIVALPLSMALAIAVGVNPQHGLYAAVVAGALVALLGGSRFQVTGPTATFIVVLSPVAARHGIGGIVTVGLMAGAMLFLLGLARLGRLIQFIPYPVTTGFTAGIACVIATLQIRDAFGLSLAHPPDAYVDKLVSYWQARGTIRPSELVVSAATLAMLVFLPKVTRRIPAPLLALGLAAAGCALAHAVVPTFEVATLGSRFSTRIGDTLHAGIPPVLPMPSLPWNSSHVSYAYFRELLPAAFTVAMLGAIESLVSASIADGMTGKHHDPNAELMALGIGNVAAAFFGAIPASGALARTATNVRAGARSPVAAVAHAGLVLLSMLFLAPALAYVPMASLAALLLVVAWNMSEARHVVRMIRVAPKSDVVVLATCLFLTVAFDMIVAVGVGVVLAALLFMRRMAELTHARALLGRDANPDDEALPDGVSVYEIAGALFFGAARNAISQLEVVASDVRVLVIDLGRVPVIDVTGLVALESTVHELVRRGCRVIIAGPLPEPHSLFERAEIEEAVIVANRREALVLARRLSAEVEAERRARASAFPGRKRSSLPPPSHVPPRSH